MLLLLLVVDTGVMPLAGKQLTVVVAVLEVVVNLEGLAALVIRHLHLRHKEITAVAELMFLRMLEVVAVVRVRLGEMVHQPLLEMVAMELHPQLQVHQ
jgi:hypothetical protein